MVWLRMQWKGREGERYFHELRSECANGIVDGIRTESDGRERRRERRRRR
jgi:hypothetical protein